MGRAMMYAEPEEIRRLRVKYGLRGVAGREMLELIRQQAIGSSVPVVVQREVGASTTPP